MNLLEIIAVLFELVLLLVKIVYYYVEALACSILPKKPKTITGEVVLITGAGHGIGRELALQFAKHGARLALWDINERDLEETAVMSRDFGGDVHTFICNVSDRKTVLETADKTRSKLGKVDILVNNAGILIGGLISDLTESEIRKTMDVNTLAHFWTLQAFLPQMEQRRHGHVVTIASVAAKVGTPYLSVYCASKWAVFGLAECLQEELELYKINGINTTIVCPTFVNTNLLRHQTKLKAQSRFSPLLEPTQVAEAVVKGVLRNQMVVYVPSNLSNISILRALLPFKAQQALKVFMDMRMVDDSKEK